MENVEVVLERVRTLRMNEIDGTVIGYSSMRLVPRDHATLVQYDVYAYIQFPLIVAAAQPDAPEAAKKAFIQDTWKRFNEELSTLKRIAEAPRR